jgi:hypothetical protein
MIAKEQVEEFLRNFKQKKKIFGVLYRDDRGKNTQTLADLEIRPADRDLILDKLKLEDYCEGPHEETLYGGSDMWIFGREIKKRAVYIKITIGIPSNSVICISFHISKHALNYPFK